MSDDFFPSDVCEASETGDLAALRQLLDAHPEWVNWRDSGGGTPLHYAANVAVLRLLVDRGGEIGSRNGSGKTPLHVAARSGESDSVFFLLNMGADVNASDRYGRTPLHEAARNGNVHVVRMLIERGSEPNRVDDRGDSPIMGIGGTTEERNLITETLLNAGAKLNLNSAMRRKKGQEP